MSDSAPNSAKQLASHPSPKKVLVVVYSQTGQLQRVAQQICAPLATDASIELTIEIVKPEVEYPFPWPFWRFLDTFPESAHMVPQALQPSSLPQDAQFDLILLCYQVWFLAPSPPIVAFLHSQLGRQLVAGRPVITVVACRNMWMLAHQRTAALLQQLNARHLDNIVLTDRASTLATLLTTPLWLLSGRKKPVPGLPEAGVSTQDIANSVRFGFALRDALHENLERGNAPLLAGLEAAQARPELMVSEKVGTRSFYLWGKLLRWAGPARAAQRLPLLVLYVTFLLSMIVTIVPLSLLVQKLLKPLLKRHHQRLKTQFEKPSGSGNERMQKYQQL
jgi:hypothetical protein